MKKIGITGSKGGVGKSTFSILLSNQLIKEGKNVLLCDCDVECPNDYLLIGQKLKKPVKKIYAEFPKLIKEKCKKCGLCVKTCKNHAIFQVPGKYPVFIKDLCSACGACQIVCPHGAIGSKKEEIGKIYLNEILNPKSEILNKSQILNSKIPNLYLVTGVAKTGLEETGPVVNEVKKFSLKYAKKIKADYILFDTAPGTHCPVISAILGCDFVFAICEPTPMGAYDLDLILNLCEKLKVKAKIVLNQADLGDKKKIKKIARKYKIKIEKEVPYSEKIVEAYSKGRLLDLKLSN